MPHGDDGGRDEAGSGSGAPADAGADPDEDGEHAPDADASESAAESPSSSEAEAESPTESESSPPETDDTGDDTATGPDAEDQREGDGPESGATVGGDPDMPAAGAMPEEYRNESVDDPLAPDAGDLPRMGPEEPPATDAPEGTTDDADADVDVDGDTDADPDAGDPSEASDGTTAANGGAVSGDVEAFGGGPVASEDLEREPGQGGPAEDQEMPLTAHIEEMLKRLAVVMVVASLVSVAAFPFGEEIIDFLWRSALPHTGTRPHLYSPLELVITQIKVASLVGLVAALPVVVYQTYLFMKPGLYPHERRYYLAAVPTSLVLAFVGIVFGYFVVLPAIFTYFYSYSKDVTEIAFALGKTFDLILVLLGYLAVVFQIPLFIMLAMMMGLVTRRWLVQRRLVFWGGFLGVSFLFSPDPTGMAPIILTLTMIVLFEGTLFLAKWTRHGQAAAGG